MAALAVDSSMELLHGTVTASKGFVDSFLRSLAVIIVTEIGDKTFFIAAILCMKYGRAVVYAGAMGALTIMHLLSSFMGYTLPALLPRFYTHYVSAALFLYFGVKLLYDAYHMSEGESNELEEVEEEMNKKDGPAEGSVAGHLESGDIKALKGHERDENFKVFTQTFMLTFLAEWGDRSQIATIALAASKDPAGVVLGGLLGHGLCTGIAVIGGKMLASRISERHVSLVGGGLFIVFGIHSLAVGPEA